MFVFQQFPWQRITVRIHYHERLHGFAKFMRFTGGNLQHLKEMNFHFAFGNEWQFEYTVGFSPRVIPTVRSVSLSVYPGDEHACFKDIYQLLVDMQLALPNVSEFKLYALDFNLSHDVVVSPYSWNLEALKLATRVWGDGNSLLQSILGTTQSLQRRSCRYYRWPPVIKSISAVAA